MKGSEGCLIENFEDKSLVSEQYQKYKGGKLATVVYSIDMENLMRWSQNPQTHDPMRNNAMNSLPFPEKFFNS